MEVFRASSLPLQKVLSRSHLLWFECVPPKIHVDILKLLGDEASER